MKLFFTTLSIFFSVLLVNGQIKGTTEDGRKILLFDNGSWQFDIDLVEMIKPVVMEAPSFKAVKGKSTTKIKSVTLKQKSVAENEITDDDKWFEKNDIEITTIEVPNPFRQIAGEIKPEIPLAYEGKRLVKAIYQERLEFLIYGKDYSEGDILYIYDGEKGKMIDAYDFTAWCYSPEFIEADKEFINQRIVWVQKVGDILYVAHGHNTYAKSSKGMNAYITAIDMNTKEVLWRSQPLISNAYNFEIIDDVIVCGYGFTAEPDFLYTLNRHTGAVIQKLPLKSGPSFIIRKQKELYVRTYNSDYIFTIE